MDLVDASERLLESMPDAIVMVGMDGRVVRVNRQAELLSGYSREELVGLAIEELVPEAFHSRHAAHRTAYQHAPAARPMGTHLDIRFRRRDGSEFPADIALSPMTTDHGILVVASVRDITERKRQDDRLRAIAEIAQATLEGCGEEELLSLIARWTRALVESALAMVALLDASGETTTVAAADGPRAGTVVGTRAPTTRDPGPSLTVRLASGGRTIGSLDVTNEADGPGFTDDDRALLELFATQAAVAIDYIRAREDLQRLALLEDRERIGRELHDGAIQMLFAIGMGLQGVAVTTADPVLRERLETTVAQIDEVIHDLRNYIFGLRPGPADRHLGSALRELGEQLERQHGVACAVDVDQAVATRLAGRAADVVQVAREALSNVGRHAGAATCRLSLRAEPGFAVLEVDDDGRGFVPGEVGGGWGLRNLGERAAALSGSLDIVSVPGEGTRVSLRIPV